MKFYEYVVLFILSCSFNQVGMAQTSFNQKEMDTMISQKTIPDTSRGQYPGYTFIYQNLAEKAGGKGNECMVVLNYIHAKLAQGTNSYTLPEGLLNCPFYIYDFKEKVGKKVTARELEQIEPVSQNNISPDGYIFNYECYLDPSLKQNSLTSKDAICLNKGEEQLVLNIKATGQIAFLAWIRNVTFSQ